MRILLAEDEAQLNRVILAALEHDGYQVDSVFNGQEALKLANQNTYNVIILDIMMPKKNGLEVCKEVRTFSNVPIIMITARGEDFERIMGLETGADDYIVKPFSPGEVIARIHAILRRVIPNENISQEKILSLAYQEYLK